MSRLAMGSVLVPDECPIDAVFGGLNVSRVVYFNSSQIPHQLGFLLEKRCFDTWRESLSIPPASGLCARPKSAILTCRQRFCEGLRPTRPHHRLPGPRRST